MSLRNRIRTALVLGSLLTSVLLSAVILPLSWQKFVETEQVETMRVVDSTIPMLFQPQFEDPAKDVRHPEQSLASWTYEQQQGWLGTVQVSPVSKDGKVDWSHMAGAGGLDQIPESCRGKLAPGFPSGFSDQTSWITGCGGRAIAGGQHTVTINGTPHDYYVAFTFTHATARSELGHLAMLCGLGALVSVLGALAVSSWLAQRVERPMLEASRSALAIADGSLAARVPVSGDDALATMGTSINRMADSLTGMLERQRRFTSDVAHELRTPVATLLAASTGLEDRSTRDEAAALVAPQLRRLAALTEDLLEISRLDDGRAELHLDEVDLDALVAAEVTASPLAGQVVTTGSAGMLTCDAPRIALIVRNLLNNAAQHGASPVAIALARTATQVTVSINDSGDGVPEHLRDKVFDRFVRGDASRHGGGSGLGLSLARENARLHGGDLRLSDDGRTFILSLPLGASTRPAVEKD